MPCPATRSALGSPGENASQPHMFGKRRALSSHRKDRPPKEATVSVASSETSFPGCVPLRDPAAAVSRAARSDAQTLRALKRGHKRHVSNCGKRRARENSLAESSTAHCGKRLPNRHRFCVGLFTRHAAAPCDHLPLSAPPSEGRLFKLKTTGRTPSGGRRGRERWGNDAVREGYSMRSAYSSRTFFLKS